MQEFSFEHTKQILKLIHKKIILILHYHFCSSGHIETEIPLIYGSGVTFCPEPNKSIPYCQLFAKSNGEHKYSVLSTIINRHIAYFENVIILILKRMLYKILIIIIVKIPASCCCDITEICVPFSFYHSFTFLLLFLI